MGCVKDHLELCCQNHPDTVTTITYASDFHHVSEGGCERPCDFRLECGHACQMMCHPLGTFVVLILDPSVAFTE